MTIADIAERYAAVFLDLSEIEVAAIWTAVLFRRVPADERLRDRVERLQGLRDDVGRESARATEAPTSAATQHEVFHSEQNTQTKRDTHACARERTACEAGRTAQDSRAARAARACVHAFGNEGQERAGDRCRAWGR